MILTVHLGLSYACNMRCKHCFVNKKHDTLNSDICKDIIDKLYDKGMMVLIYTYGEPLLAANFDEISSYASKKGISQVLMTNGYFLTRKNIDMLKRNKVASVYVSLDSVESKEHDENRNCVGAFDKAIKGIDLLKKNEINVGLAITITKNNQNMMYDFLDFAIKHNIKNISFLRERSNGEIAIFDDENYFKFIEENINYTDINIQYHDPLIIPLIKKIYKENKISKQIYEKYISMNDCHMSTNLCIEPNGDVTRCNISKNIIGNIENCDINKIITRSEKNENFVCCAKFSKKN